MPVASIRRACNASALGRTLLRVALGGSVALTAAMVYAGNVQAAQAPLVSERRAASRFWPAGR